MNNRDVKFINGGKPLTFDPNTEFAINPENQNSIAFAGDYRNQVLTISGTGTVVVYGSCQKDPVDFTQPSTISNSYVAITLADYSLVQTYYAGSTGVTVIASTVVVELNTNLLTWIGINRSGGNVDVKFTETDNQ